MGQRKTKLQLLHFNLDNSRRSFVRVLESEEISVENKAQISKVFERFLNDVFVPVDNAIKAD